MELKTQGSPVDIAVKDTHPSTFEISFPELDRQRQND